MIRRPLGALGTKLFLGVFASSALLLFVLSTVSMRRTTGLWTRSFEEHAAETGKLIEAALRYAMLSNRKDDLHAALRDLGKEPAVESLRIYDKNGRIMVSTQPGEVGRRVGRDARACVGCHQGGKASPGQQGFSRVFQNDNGQQILSRIHPIANAAQCSTARCHAHSPERSVLGILELSLSAEAIHQAQSEARRIVAGAGVLLALVSGLVSALFIQRFVRRPVQTLTAGTKRVAAGDLKTRIEIEDPGELQDLANAFNAMIEELGQARQQSLRWEEELTQAVAEKTESLSRAQRLLGQMEKMASLGKLSATVAHELNNPLAGILVYAKLIQRELASDHLTPEVRSELLRYLSVIAQESSRCGDIVRNLLTFARESKGAFSPHPLKGIVERSLMTLRHLFQQSQVECRVQLLEDDELVCDENQIQQALVALLVNAVEAMPKGGSIEIRASGDSQQIQLEVADTGVGIPPEILPTIFEPFFSTKGDEKGVGLGLAVVYGIAHRHAGTVEVQSTPGQGAVFRLILPRDRALGLDSRVEPQKP